MSPSCFPNRHTELASCGHDKPGDRRGIGKIPAELGNLKNLVSIDLSFNKLTGEIPTSFANLTRLKLLNLFANELQGVLPEFVGYLSWKSYKHGKTISPESSLPTWARTVGC